MNYLWGGMIIIGIIYGAFTGNMQAVTDAAISSCKEAVTLCITMTGIIALWTGLMKIGEDAGLITRMCKAMQPVISFLFPDIPKNHPAVKHLSTNIIANVLGLGWASTPAGLRAMEELENLEDSRRAGKLPGPLHEKGVAGNEMCTFLIINISSLQLIPVNIIAYRSQYGSVNPTAIVGPAIVATLVSTVVAVIFCKVMDHR